MVIVIWHHNAQRTTLFHQTSMVQSPLLLLERWKDVRALQGCLSCFHQSNLYMWAKLTVAAYLVSQDVVDKVRGYVGMRKISLGCTERHGHLRPLLNNEFVFQIGFLDQVCMLPCV